ncbi:MAG: hypothetical protein EAY75_15345 [Bacteroidetes bacterium]|nr:MAG: hypothetical protein EAY75_15345 [Bacteroidota bacterium]
MAFVLVSGWFDWLYRKACILGHLVRDLGGVVPTDLYPVETGGAGAERAERAQRCCKGRRAAGCSGRRPAGGGARPPRPARYPAAARTEVWICTAADSPKKLMAMTGL